MVWQWFCCGTVFVCPQFPHHGNDVKFSCCPSRVLYVTLANLKSLNSSFIWGHHHLHLVGIDYQFITWLLQYLLHRTFNCWRDPTRSKQLGTVVILGFQFRLPNVAFPLSFLLSISLALIFFNVLTTWNILSKKWVNILELQPRKNLQIE